MTIHNILLELGIPSKEIRERFRNKQIKVNNQVADFRDEVSVVPDYIELGNFVYYNLPLNYPSFIDIKDFFGPEEGNVECLRFLEAYTLITISKREHYVFLSN